VHLSFIVPVIMSCLVTRVSPTSFRIIEISNNPSGYTVYIENAVTGKYDNKPFVGPATLTKVDSLSVGVKVDKLLVLDSDGSIQITCSSN
jgi:hypothetical protein